MTTLEVITQEVTTRETQLTVVPRVVARPLEDLRAVVPPQVGPRQEDLPQVARLTRVATAM